MIGTLGSAKFVSSVITLPWSQNLSPHQLMSTRIHPTGTQWTF